MLKNILLFAVGAVLAACAPQIARLGVNPSTATLNKLEQNVAINLAATDANGNIIAQPQVTWASSDPSVASVDASGMVTAKKGGAANISVQAGQVVAKVPVTVAIYSALKVTPEKLDLKVGDKSILQAQLLDEKGGLLTGALTWASENEKVAKVDTQGHVEAIGPGAAKLIVHVQDLNATVNVTIAAAVKAPPAAQAVPAAPTKPIKNKAK